MTTSTLINFKRSAGNGATVNFAFPYPYFDPDEVIVALETIADGTITAQVRNTDYTLADDGVGNPNGDDIVFTTAPSALYNVVRYRKPTLAQTYNPAGRYDPDRGEEALDRIYQILQYHDWVLSKTVRLQDEHEAFDVKLPHKSERKGKVMGFDADGEALAMKTINDEALLQAASTLGIAMDWAIKQNGIVQGSDYSSKAWAVGGTEVTGTSGRGAAKEWATRTDAAVDASEFSAKAYAVGGSGVTNAAGKGAAKEWATKAENSTVDGTEYSAKHYSAKASASASAASTSAGSAAGSAAAAALSASALAGTSASSVAIGAGSKAFVTQAGKSFAVGAWLLITSDADPSNYMHGQVTAYSGTALTVDVTNIGGAGTLDDWTIRVSGTRGATGATGAAGADGADGADGSGFVSGIATLPEKSSDPATPSAGNVAFYAKNDKKLYTKDSTGAVSEVGVGAFAASLDALFFDQRVTTLHSAEAEGAAIFSGPDGSALHDGFDELTYVDTAGATNLDSGTAGQLKAALGPSAISTSGKTLIGDLTGGGGLAAAADGNTSQAYAVCASKAPTASGYGNTWGVYWGASESHIVTQVTLYAPNDGSIFTAGSTTWKFQGSDDGSSWTDLYTSGSVSFPTNSITTIDASDGLIVTTAYHYHRIDISGSGANGMFLCEAVFYEDVLQDLVVQSQAFAASAVPATMRGVLRIDDAAGVTLNTDIDFAVSRDGGTTWTVATLTEKYTEPGNVRVLDTGNVDVSAQPSDTSMLWRYRSYAPANPKFLGVSAWGTA